MITLIDYGAGNLASVARMFTRLGESVDITADPAHVARAECLVLPGVGFFDQAMTTLHRRGLTPLLHDLVLEKGVPVLGICLGMQMFARSSEEGSASGLGWIDGHVKRLPSHTAEGTLRVPHIGWNDVTFVDESLFSTFLGTQACFYFAHSYYVALNEAEVAAGYTDYGMSFPSVICKGNIIGVQFHPEKSHKNGERLLRAFLDLRAHV